MKLIQLEQAAKRVLAANDQGDYTVPSTKLYPHQWLWDSAFIAIGLAHYDPVRAAQEIQTLLRSQWGNGMIPHVVFGASEDYWLDQKFWRSNRSKFAPRQVLTSGITQPPVIAMAAEIVAEHLGSALREEFIRQVYPALVAYHQWWYRERDPKGTGLVVLVHLWENGLDNTPPWTEMLQRVRLPLYLNIGLKLGLKSVVNRLRPDTRIVPTEERLDLHDAARSVVLAAKLRRKGYDGKKILKHPTIAVESLTTNCLLVVSNESLGRLAGLIDAKLPHELATAATRTKRAIQQLWDGQEFYSRDYTTGQLIKSPSINTFFPLIAGVATKAQAAKLVELLQDPKRYWPQFPVPTAALDWPGFSQKRYWQGPTWVNTNWLIIQGLRRYGYDDLASELRAKTLALVEKSGFSEYFSPLDGKPYGIEGFSWTAALVIDLLNE